MQIYSKTKALYAQNIYAPLFLFKSMVCLMLYLIFAVHVVFICALETFLTM